MRDIIFFMIFFTIAVIPIVSAVTIKVEAPENVTANETFSVNIIVDNITNLNTALFDLSFNSSILKVEKVEDGQIGGEVVPVDMWDFISDNTIRILVMLPGDKGVSGSGYLAKVVFKAIGVGSLVLDLENGQLSDNKAEEIKAEWIDAVVNVTTMATPTTTVTPIPTTNATEANITTTPTVTTTVTAVTTTETPVATMTTVVTTTTTTIPTTTPTTTIPATTTTTIPTTLITTSPVTTTTTSVKITTTTATITTTKTTVTTITQTTTTAKPVSKKETPCFEAVFALSILILVVLLRRRM